MVSVLKQSEVGQTCDHGSDTWKLENAACGLRLAARVGEPKAQA
jgi:hypothetical protein